MEFKSQNGQQTLLLTSTLLEVKAAEAGRAKTIPLESMVKFMISKKDPCLVRFVGKGAGEDIAFHFEKGSDAALVSKSLNVGAKVKKEPIVPPTPGVRGLIGSLEALVDSNTNGIRTISEGVATDLFAALPSLATAYEASVVSEETEMVFWRAVVEQYLCFKRTWLADEEGGSAAEEEGGGGEGAISMRAASLWVDPTVRLSMLGAKRSRGDAPSPLNGTQRERRVCPSQPFLTTKPPTPRGAFHRPLHMNDVIQPLSGGMLPRRVSAPTPADVRSEIAVVWDCINRNAMAEAKIKMQESPLIQDSPSLPEIGRLRSVLALVAP